MESARKGLDIHLSCSVGIAFYPRDGRDFYSLFCQANQALYHVKNTGKGGYAVYNSSMHDYRDLKVSNKFQYFDL
ncbi:diguanylate cyclase domain-containing protein [Robinsoniella peoriensis]|uniref:diguanylate cyclase domain-containing protein n=1 Tax=Robinsoniella peoriensis TaxID=180332 RepID=UPI00363CFC71